MRICIVYDCLYPHTVGGAERWYRSLAERLAADGHDVTYLTLRQWAQDDSPDIDDCVRVVAVGPQMELYGEGGQRRILPPLRFGAGVLWHLLRHGRRYDVVHTASFPYFSLLAAGLVRPLHRYRLVVDWFEVWTREYWQEYLGRVAGRIGHGVQSLCERIPQRAFCFSRLHAERLEKQGLRGSAVVLTGIYAGTSEPVTAVEPDRLVVFAGRLIPEKRPALAADAMARAAQRLPGLEGVVYGDGPERAAVERAISELGADGVVSAPGFVDAEVIDAAMRRALCLLLPSRREGYGLVVVEAAARGTPTIVVAGSDNAATELIEDGVNGFIVGSDEADALASAIVRVSEAGLAMRASTAEWFAANAERLSLEGSLKAVLQTYAAPASARR